MGLLKTLLIVPALASAVWLMNANTSAGILEPTRVSLTDRSPASLSQPEEVEIQAVQDLSESEMERQVISRQMRIERLLVTLDQIAEVALQMGPEQTASLELVILDLAEQTLELAEVEAILNPDTEGDLDEIEITVDGLISALERYVEPEMML